MRFFHIITTTFSFVTAFNGGVKRSQRFTNRISLRVANPTVSEQEQIKPRSYVESTSNSLRVESNTCDEVFMGRCIYEFDGYTVRPAVMTDLGAAVALLVSSFFGKTNWFTQICMRELGRLRENFPPQQRSLSFNDFDFRGARTPALGLNQAVGRQASASTPQLESRGLHVMLVAEVAPPAEVTSDATADAIADVGRRMRPADATAERQQREAAVARAGRMAGFVNVDFRPAELPQPDEAPRPYLMDLAVCPCHRRRGIARSLVLACEDVVRREGARLLHLEYLGKIQALKKNNKQFGQQQLSTRSQARPFDKAEPAAGALLHGTVSARSPSFSAAAPALDSLPPVAFGTFASEAPDLEPLPYVLRFPLKLHLKAERCNVGAMRLYRGLGYTVERDYAEDSKVLLSKVVAHAPSDLACT